MANGVAVTSSFSNNFDKRIKKLFFDDYARFDKEWTKIVNVSTHDENFLKESDASAFSTMEAVEEGQGGSLDNFKQGNTKTQYFVEYKHNFQVTRVMRDDDLQGMMKKAPKKQALSCNYTLEYLNADLLNSGFSSSTSPELGLDGLSLFNGSHTYIDNGSSTQDNESANALSYSALQSALTDFNKLEDEKGNPIPMAPNLLVVPPDLEWKAIELLGRDAKLDPTNANNTVNVLKEGRPGLKYFVYHFLTSTTAWFLLDKKNADLRWIWRVKPEYKMWADENTGNVVYGAYMRGTATNFNWRGTWGSTGA